MANNFGKVNVSITASTGGLTAGLADASKQLAGFRASSSGASGTIDALNASMAESSGLFSDVPGLFGSFASAILGVGRSATTASIGVKVLSLAIKTLLVPLGIVTAVVAPFKALASAASSLDDSAKAARRFGMSISTFQNLSQVAEEAGVGVDQLTTLFTALTKNLGGLANGSAGAQKAFASIGLEFAQLRGLSPEAQFELIAKRIMSLPTAAQRTVAAMAIFGKQGAAAMGLISDAADGGVTEISRLREQLGLNITDAQVAGIEMMNDALGRLSMPVTGFINQFLAELAPAITTVSNLIVEFFARNTEGWSVAQTLANGLVQSIRMVVGAVTLLTGVFQMFTALGSQIGQMFSELFGLILKGVANVLKSMSDLAETIPGFDVGLASSLSQAAAGSAQMARGAEQMGRVYGDAAATTFKDAVHNMGSPFSAFDAEFARVTAEAQQAAASTATGVAESVGDTIGSAIKAASSELKAIVVGTSEGESFRNSLARGGDPRLAAADAAKATADNTERAADGIDELVAKMGDGGLGLATITV